MRIEFRILGPLELSTDGRVLPLGSPKQRALLALLVIHANETVSRDRLIEELWGDAERAADRLRQALALWRGPALADLESERFAIAAAARLEERRLSALEQRLEADLALARHRELVGELETLVAEHPYRERPRAQLMLALYRSGRQAEALRTYQQARRTLADELGLEPGSELKELEQAILRQDPTLTLEPSAKAQSEPQP